MQISISPNLPQYSGRTLLSLATERGHDPVDTLCDYLVDDQGATRVLVTSISEDDIETIVASPMALVGSDGNCVAPYGQVGKGMPHPRFYGTFPRILHHYVRERGALPLELAIHKMTGATARALKLSDRGLLKEGCRADVAVFDPADFKDRATYADPHQFPSGARTTVIVNGVTGGGGREAYRGGAGDCVAAGCEGPGGLTSRAKSRPLVVGAGPVCLPVMYQSTAPSALSRRRTAKRGGDTT